MVGREYIKKEIIKEARNDPEFAKALVKELEPYIKDVIYG